MAAVNNTAAARGIRRGGGVKYAHVYTVLLSYLYIIILYYITFHNTAAGFMTPPLPVASGMAAVYNIHICI